MFLKEYTSSEYNFGFEFEAFFPKSFEVEDLEDMLGFFKENDIFNFEDITGGEAKIKPDGSLDIKSKGRIDISRTEYLEKYFEELFEEFIEEEDGIPLNSYSTEWAYRTVYKYLEYNVFWEEFKEEELEDALKEYGEEFEEEFGEEFDYISYMQDKEYREFCEDWIFNLYDYAYEDWIKNKYKNFIKAVLIGQQDGGAVDSEIKNNFDEFVEESYDRYISDLGFSSDSNVEYIAYEYSSPVLKFNLRNIKIIIKSMKKLYGEFGNVTNNSCGFHNHISFSNISLFDKLWILLGLSSNEKLKDYFFKPNMELYFYNEQYANRRSFNFIKELEYVFTLSEDIEEGNREVVRQAIVLWNGEHDRYSAFSIKSSVNTIELRGGRFGELKGEEAYKKYEFYYKYLYNLIMQFDKILRKDKIKLSNGKLLNKKKFRKFYNNTLYIGDPYNKREKLEIEREREKKQKIKFQDINYLAEKFNIENNKEDKGLVNLMLASNYGKILKNSLVIESVLGDFEIVNNKLSEIRFYLRKISRAYNKKVGNKGEFEREFKEGVIKFFRPQGESNWENREKSEELVNCIFDSLNLFEDEKGFEKCKEKLNGSKNNFLKESSGVYDTRYFALAISTYKLIKKLGLKFPSSKEKDKQLNICLDGYEKVLKEYIESVRVYLKQNATERLLVSDVELFDRQNFELLDYDFNKIQDFYDNKFIPNVVIDTYKDLEGLIENFKNYSEDQNFKFDDDFIIGCVLGFNDCFFNFYGGLMYKALRLMESLKSVENYYFLGFHKKYALVAFELWGKQLEYITNKELETYYSWSQYN